MTLPTESSFHLSVLIGGTDTYICPG